MNDLSRGTDGPPAACARIAFLGFPLDSSGPPHSPELCWNEGMRKRITDELKKNGASEAHATSDEYEDEFEEIFGFSFPSHSVNFLHSDTPVFGDSMLLMTVDTFNATKAAVP